MVMTLQPNVDGYIVTQSLRRPVVYLDHWAIRMFSDERPLQDRFIEALHSSGGTWLFSQVNLFEFVAMTDLAQGAAAEALLLRAMPALHVADITMDKGYLFADGIPQVPEGGPQHWLLEDLGMRASIAGGVWNMHRFVQDAIIHRDELLPLFDELKKDGAERMSLLTQDPDRIATAKKFVPRAGMTLRDALMHELLRDAYVNPGYAFDENDATDLLHALAPSVVCDFTLLDGRWCHRVEVASRRMRQGGVTGRIAKPFSKKRVADFLATLEASRVPS